MLGFAGEARGWVDLSALGAFVTNPLTWSARTPAVPPNAVPLAGGLLIHTGLPNPGVRAALARFRREWARLNIPVIVHLAATTPEEVSHSLEVLERVDSVSGVELGLRDDVTEAELAALVRAAMGGPPLIVRLPAGKVRAVDLCRDAIRAGADALTVGAPPRLTVEVDGRTVAGRAYGPDQFEIALDAVKVVLATLGEDTVPVIGAGGVFSPEAARRMLDAGARAFQVDAALWRDPTLLQTLSAVTPSDASSET
jgi:dihydroorotate dehydrogenase (NAD+) catalytic subunit